MVERQQGLAVWFLGSLMLFKATGADNSQTFSLIEQTLPPGFAPPLHVHHAEDEAFYVLEGAFTFVCGETAGMLNQAPSSFCPGRLPMASWWKAMRQGDFCNSPSRQDWKTSMPKWANRPSRSRYRQ
jgi:hypothetical protein